MNAALDPASVYDDSDPPTLRLATAGQAWDPDATGEYDPTELATLLAVCLTLELEI